MAMRISMARLKRVGSTLGKIVIGLAVASTIGGMSVGPALGEDSHRRDKYHQREYRRPAYQPYGYQPYQPYVYPSYSYFVPVPPPPVVYVPPPPSFGFSLFFPIRIH
jgi:hypothetical protein